MPQTSRVVSRNLTLPPVSSQISTFPLGAAAGEITVANQDELLYVHNRVEAATDPLEKGEASKDNKHRHQSLPPAAPPAVMADHSHRSQEEDEKQNNRNRSEPSRGHIPAPAGRRCTFLSRQTAVTRAELATVVRVLQMLRGRK